jgi:hypothetical protein
MMAGKKNMVAGVWLLAGFMVYGFVLIYLRDFAPGKEEWIAGSLNGKHFESRLAHVHGNLFALINLLIGYLLWQLPIAEKAAKRVSWLALIGLLMPIGILTEVLFGVPPLLVIVGGISIVLSMILLGFALIAMNTK